MAESADLKPVYLLTGSDRPKIETALARLRRHFEPEAVELVSAQELSGPEAAALSRIDPALGVVRERGRPRLSVRPIRAFSHLPLALPLELLSKPLVGASALLDLSAVPDERDVVDG